MSVCQSAQVSSETVFIAGDNGVTITSLQQPAIVSCGQSLVFLFLTLGTYGPEPVLKIEK